MSEPVTDVLGAPYTVETLRMRPDHEGEVVATLVRRPADLGSCAGRPDRTARGAVLHVHGFADYFFQTAYAEWWTARGWDFYALDLRKYGRSIRGHQTPTHEVDLAAYDEELDAAYERITARDGHSRVLTSGHSTGGLVVPLWASRRSPDLAGMVLNAPWLDLAGSWLLRTVGTRAVDLAGAVLPTVVVPRRIDGQYGRSLHSEHGGVSDFDLAWKPLDSFPVRLGWLRAVRRAHATLHRGLRLEPPILVLTSASSALPPFSAEDLRGSDVVLDVEQMWRWAPRLGPRVSVVAVEGARHDVVLSEEPSLSRVYDELEDWVEAFVPG